MPSSLEKLIKILKQEEKNGYTNRAVIGGMQAYAPHWGVEARQEAQRAEQSALVDELLMVMEDYHDSEDERAELATYMMERITRRVQAKPKYRVIVQQDVDYSDLDDDPNERDTDEDDENFARREDAVRDTQTVSAVMPKPRRASKTPAALEDAAVAYEQLAQPLTTVPGIGVKMAEKLARLGLQTVGDMLYFFPRRYDDYQHMPMLNRVEPDKLYTIIGTIERVFERKLKNRGQVLVVQITDGKGRLEINFFNQPWLRKQMKIGLQLVFSGKTSQFRDQVIMTNPNWEPVDQQTLYAGGIVPIYPLTKGISARIMRRMVKAVVEHYADVVPDPVPDAVLDRTEQVELGWALRQAHFPQKMEFKDYARQRLAFDELLRLQLGVMQNRADWQDQPAPQLPLADDWLAGFQEALPFTLTGAQQRAIETIRADLAKDVPMNRLLQGDVGAGKTMVAAVTLAIAILNGKQAAMMAPTGILAEQHYQKLLELFPALPALADTRIALLTGALPEAEKRELRQQIANGEVDLVIGTHAIIQDGVEFSDLGAAVIDEQHRFGVRQRGMLRGKGQNPHLLVMSATPIPRTLALTLYADLDLTILDEMPPGRTPIQTRILPPTRRARVYDFLKDVVLDRGQQVYIIFPLVEASDKIDAESAVEGYDYIREHIYPQQNIGLLHGRMKDAEKDAVMTAFANNEIQVLVSTTVIEVGVDVPNATAIVIENAERFGLAQLHQLRGRVGRGAIKSYCVLIAEEASERLQALEDTTDGFKLAELDWQQRGAGDLLGVRQSGSRDVKFAEMMDVHLVEVAQKECQAIFAEDPQLALPDHQLLAKQVQDVRDARTDLS